MSADVSSGEAGETAGGSPSIVPRKWLLKAWAFWYWIAIAGILGGLLGWGGSLFFPARFRATAVLAIDIDYNRALPLDELAESHAFDRVRGLLVSDPVIERTMSILRETSGSGPSSDDLLDFRSSLAIGNRTSRWELSALAADPVLAQTTANAWADSALLALGQAQVHAIQAAEYQKLLFETGCRLVEAPGGEPTAVWQCDEVALDLEPDEIVASLLEEARLSQGILPAVSFNMLPAARVPDRPVAGARGGLILSGVLIGLTAGSILVFGKAAGGRKGPMPGAAAN